MSLLFRTFALVLAGALSLPAAASSCYVSTDTSGVVPPPVVTEKCFEYHGVDDEKAIDWVCSDSEAVENSRRELRDSCPAGHFGVCSAPMTAETLANERATGTQADNGTLPTTVAKDARIITYNYHASDRGQARIDCESAGGEWSQ